MQVSPIDFDKYIASYPDFPKPGILFRDISPLLASAEGMNCAIDQLASSCWLEARPCCGDRVAWLSVFHPACARLGIGSMMIRKPGKLPGKLSP